MYCYEIAGLSIGVELKNELKYIKNRMKPFLKEDNDFCNFTIEINETEAIRNPSGEVLINEDTSINWVSKEKKCDGIYGYMTRIASGEILAMLDTDLQWEKTSVCYTNSLKFIKQDVNPIELMTFHLMGALFRNRILFHEGIVIHASSIKWGDKGIIFSAPSGTGKSTHVKLWEKYISGDVTVLNDDTPAVRIHGEQAFIYGTPWSGSSDKFVNIRAPLSAIVILEQAFENTICKLSTFEAITRIMPRCFLPYFDKKLMDIAIKNLESIICKTPFFLLKCRPDKEAMELVAKCV